MQNAMNVITLLYAVALMDLKATHILVVLLLAVAAIPIAARGQNVIPMLVTENVTILVSASRLAPLLEANVSLLTTFHSADASLDIQETVTINARRFQDPTVFTMAIVQLNMFV